MATPLSAAQLHISTRFLISAHFLPYDYPVGFLKQLTPYSAGVVVVLLFILIVFTSGIPNLCN